MTVENLNIEASVIEDFDATLDRLADKLLDVAEAEELAFPIEVDVDGAEQAYSELTAVASAAERIDDADVDVGSSVGVDSDELFGDFNAAEQSVAEDFIGPYQFQDPATSAGAGGGGATATADGRGRDMDFSYRPDTPGAMAALAEGMESADIERDLRLSVAELPQFAFDDPEQDRSLLERIEQFDLGMSTFYSLLASLLPLLGTIVAALPAAIAGIVALGAAALSAAGALAVVGGLGLLGMGLQDGEFSTDPITEQLSQLRETFIEAFSPVATMLASDMRDLFHDIERLFNEMARHADTLRGAGALLDQLGDGLVEYLPDIVDNIVRLGQMAAPIFGNILAALGSSNFAAIVASLLNKLYPVLRELGAAIIQMLPGLIELSRGFLMATTILVKFISIIFQIIEALGPLAPLLGLLIGVGAILYSFLSVIATLAVNTMLTSMAMNYLNTSLLGATGSAITLSSALKTLVPIVGTLLAVIGAAAWLSGAFKPDIADPSQLTTGTPRTTGGSNPYQSAGTNNYYINANNRQDANRQTQTLDYNSEYRTGTQNDSSFSP